MKKVAIIGANGQIAHLVEERLLAETDVELTLLLRNSNRLANLADNPRVRIIDGDAKNPEDLKQAIQGQDLVYVSFVDHGAGATLTKNVIRLMDEAGVKRLISSNILGIYDEVPGEFGRYNREVCFGGKVLADNPMVVSDREIENSDLDYTVMRIAWLNDRSDTNYTVTHKGEEYVGVSASRKSVADVVTRIVKDFDLFKKESIGFADPATQGATRPVY